MKKIFLLTAIITSFLSCDNEEKKQNHTNGMLGPITFFSIRLVDVQGNWIEGIEEKEMELLVADSNWKTLDPQPENYSYSLDNNPFYSWGIEKHYDYVRNEKGEAIEKKVLLYIEIFTLLKDLSYDPKNDDTYGGYVVLKIDENTSLNIQLFYKEFYNFAGPCIEKFICNGKEYINIESVTNYRYGKDGVKEVKINDIVIE